MPNLNLLASKVKAHRKRNLDVNSDSEQLSCPKGDISEVFEPIGVVHLFQLKVLQIIPKIKLRSIHSSSFLRMTVRRM